MRVQKSWAEYGFTYYDRLRLQKALQLVADKRVFVQLQAVLLFAHSVNIHDIVLIAGIGKRAVYYWVGRYFIQRQLDALFDVPRSCNHALLDHYGTTAS